MNNRDPSGEFSLGVSIAMGDGIGALAGMTAYYGLGRTAGQSAGIGIAFGFGAFGLAYGGSALLASKSIFQASWKAYLGAGSAPFLWAGMWSTLNSRQRMDPDRVAAEIRDLVPGGADDDVSNRIAKAVANTFNNNSNTEIRNLFGFSSTQRANGFFCYEWVWAFERAIQSENDGTFQAEVQTATTTAGLDHWWIKLSPTGNPDAAVYLDDGFYPIENDTYTYAHKVRPCALDKPVYEPNEYVFKEGTHKIELREEDRAPIIYNSNGNIVSPM